MFLWRVCWHIGLANTNALLSCGIAVNEKPSAPAGGVIDFEAGSVTGILRERAVEVVMRAVNVRSKEEKKHLIKNGLNMCLKFGLTCVQSNDEDAMDAYQDMVTADELPLRVFLTPTHGDIFGECIESEDYIGMDNKSFKKPFRPCGIGLGSTLSPTGGTLARTLH